MGASVNSPQIDMAFEGISQLIRHVPVLEPRDTVRRAASLARESGLSRLFVQRDGRIMGSVSERAIAALLSRSGNAEEVLESSIDGLIEPHTLMVNSQISAQDAARVFADTGEDVLSITDNFGSYFGVICRRDVVGLLTKNLRPPSVGGMATPLGVYLTTGSVTGGAGNLGLFLTGVSIGAMLAAAQLVVFGLVRLVEVVTKLPIEVYLSSVPLPFQANLYDLPLYVLVALTVVAFLALMRLSPLSGYHAAEHMTVHAIEAGETLTPERVRHMPRVHPRCGTSLLPGAGVFIILVSRFGGMLGVLLALAVVILGWRAVGGWLQYFVTTKNPSERQLRSGIAAGKEILEEYQAQPHRQAVGFERVWRFGFLQTLAGLAFSLWILGLVIRLPGF